MKYYLSSYKLGNETEKLKELMKKGKIEEIKTINNDIHKIEATTIKLI